MCTLCRELARLGGVRRHNHVGGTKSERGVVHGECELVIALVHRDDTDGAVRRFEGYCIEAGLLSNVGLQAELDIVCIVAVRDDRR